MIQRAVLTSNLHMIAVLRSLGADLDVDLDQHNTTPLLHALLSGKESVAVELLRCGADPNATMEASQGSRTAMYIAVEKGSERVVRALLHRGVSVNANVSATPNFTRTLQVAISFGQFSLVPVLIECGADVNYGNSTQLSPLQYACLADSAYTVHYLLSHGADPTVEAGHCMSAWHLAAERDSCELLVMLLRDGRVDINQISSSAFGKVSALHLAAKFNRVDSVCELLERGADINVRDVNGHSASDLATQQGSKDALRALSFHLSTSGPIS